MGLITKSPTHPRVADLMTNPRLFNVKELQSIVDYTHAPSASDAANLGPAIDTDFFNITELADGTTYYEPDYGYFWTNTSADFGGRSCLSIRLRRYYHRR